MFYPFLLEFCRHRWCRRLFSCSIILDTLRHILCWRTLLCALIALLVSYSLCYPILVDKKKQEEEEIVRISDQYRQKELTHAGVEI